MKKRALAAVGSGICVILLGATPALASQDIGWTWNSGDRDLRGKFVADGDNFKGEEFEGNTYLDWTASGSGNGRWYVPRGGVETLNLSLPENRAVTMNVCQYKTGWPDDCSGTKSGVS